MVVPPLYIAMLKTPKPNGSLPSPLPSVRWLVPGIAGSSRTSLPEKSAVWMAWGTALYMPYGPWQCCHSRLPEPYAEPRARCSHDIQAPQALTLSHISFCFF